MTSKQPLWGPMLFTMLLGAASVQAADQCMGVFDYPVQSHASPGKLSMTDGSSIVGASQPANYPFLSASLGGQSGCSTSTGNAGGQYVGSAWQSYCGITGALATPLADQTFKADPKDFPAATQDFPSYSGGSNVSCNGAINLSPGNYGAGNWSGWNCQATLESGKNYYFQSLSLSGGAALNVNGANVFVKTLTMQDSSKLQGTGTLNANSVTLNEGATLSGLAIRVHDTLAVAVNQADQVAAARFQPHSLNSLTLGAQSVITLANGQWAIRTLTMKNNSRINFVDSGSTTKAHMDIYTLAMMSESKIYSSGTGSPPDNLLIKLYQSLSMQDGSAVKGYVHAHYLDQLSLSGTHEVVFYLSGGEHWIDKLSISNTNLDVVVDDDSTARLYVNGDISLRGQMNVNAEGSANNFLFYGFGKATLSGNAKLNAILYVKAGNLTMSDQAVLTGAVSAVNVTMSGWGSKIIHEPFTGDWPDVCQPEGVTLHHFELDHTGSGLTCNPESVTVRACADLACTALVTDPVEVQLSVTPESNGLWVGGGNISLSGGAASVSLRGNKPGVLTIGVASATPQAGSATLCRAAGGEPSAEDCTLDFADSGFLFEVQDTYANKPQQVLMKAVKKDDASQQCVPGFADVSKPVSFWSDYIDPTGNAFGSKVTVNGSAVATSQAAAASTELAFDAQGEVTLTVNYPDAGKMQLNARHEGSGDSAGLVMTGADQFVSRPVGLCITPTQGTCAAGDITCPVFKRTGDSFSLNIQAMAWQSDSDGDICTGNGTTPNFVLSDIALTSELVAPQGGVVAQVTPTRYSHVAASASLNTPTLSLNEVGVFRIKATPPAATLPEGSTVSTGYFGYTIPPATSVPLGRFVPWDFNMTSGTVTPACGGFSYMSQPFGIQTVVEARNKEGSVTRNYRDAFARGALTLVAANNQDGVDRSNRLAPLAASWTEGTGKQSGQTRFMRLRELTPSLTAPEEPLPLLRLGLRVTDGETPETSFLSGRNMNPAVSGNCQSGVNCTARQLSILQGENDTMIAYYGRLLASTRQGAASAPLALPLQVQYFEGGLWRANSQDRRANSQDICTQISLAGGGIVFTDAEQRYDSATGDLILKDGTRIRLGLGNVAPGGTQVGFDAGETRFHFAPPNQAVRIPYRIVLEQQPSQPVWLADPATADHLLGEAIFGRDRGNDRIIYRREVMP
ncbi:DUF6701 domain-containing protein [Aeromonas caviae]|uniref:DUF6701 domain-containing protein n=1 Tax=Aeromonas caviae TaxID=648 RepID=UPI001376E25A|nr:DUF6701 domain-containing protein [Aeromonas caviae]NBA14803.1 hypothetical protein [Aeromonas caviae]BDN86501.1 hypothetical protein KAM471c_03160 [Aeromonas caviae]GKR37108.1 hypothetical protein KAM471_28720 [Aeromonas caviae]